MRIDKNKKIINNLLYVNELISRIETVRRALAKYEQTFSFFFTAVPSSVTKACDWAFIASLT